MEKLEALPFPSGLAWLWPWLPWAVPCSELPRGMFWKTSQGLLSSMTGSLEEAHAPTLRPRDQGTQDVVIPVTSSSGTLATPWLLWCPGDTSPEGFVVPLCPQHEAGTPLRRGTKQAERSNLLVKPLRFLSSTVQTTTAGCTHSCLCPSKTALPERHAVQAVAIK